MMLPRRTPRFLLWIADRHRSAKIYIEVLQEKYGCGLRTGIDQLKSEWLAGNTSMSCGLRTGIDQLKSKTRRMKSSQCCGLRTGIDQLK